VSDIGTVLVRLCTIVYIMDLTLEIISVTVSRAKVQLRPYTFPYTISIELESFSARFDCATFIVQNRIINTTAAFSKKKAALQLLWFFIMINSYS